MKYLLFICLITSGCGSKFCKMTEQEKISHSCPEPGHGQCYLCDDPINVKKNFTATTR